MVDPRALAEDSLIEENFLIELKANGKSDSTLDNYRKAVRTLENLDKPLKNISKQDVVEWSANLRDAYAESSQTLYKACVKRYLKWLKTGDLNGGEYPECVKWMKTSNSNNGHKLPDEILSHKEIKKLAEAAERQRDRTMVWAGYESGCRSGELLTLKLRDVEFDEYGAQVMVDGKTGERRIRLIESVPDLRTWLSMHPNKDNPEAYLWPSKEGGHLENVTWNFKLKKMADAADIDKNVYPHLLRHSRATHLAAKGINEAQMREIFGWKKNSDMPSVYVHLSGRDTDRAVLEMYDIEIESSENQFETSVKTCSFCGHENSPNAKFCEECNAPLDSMAAEQTDEKIRKQEGHVQELLEFIKEKHPKAIIDFYEEKENVQELQRLRESKARTEA